jgi:hypothetical protein
METIKILSRKLSLARSGDWVRLALLAALGMALTGLAGAENRSAAIPLSEIGAKVTTDCLGEPRAVYALLRATDVRFTENLTTLLTTNPPSPAGLSRCTDTSPPEAAEFYRMKRE